MFHCLHCKFGSFESGRCKLCLVAKQFKWLQEGHWNVLWMSGRFKTLVRMQEDDVPDGRLLSSSLKSTIFHAHEGEWQVRTVILKCASAYGVGLI